MKKIFILLIISMTFSLGLKSQVMESENMEGLNIGIVNADIEEELPGQGGYYTYAPTSGSVTNSSPNNFQIIQSKSSVHGKVLQVEGADWGDGWGIELRRISKRELMNNWTGREPGNDVLIMKYDFYTGKGETESNNIQKVGLQAFDIDITTVMLSLVELCYEPKTRTVWGQVWRVHPESGQEGNYGLYLGPNDTDVILPEDTWVSVTLSWNYNSGEVNLVSDYFNILINGSLGGRVDPMVASVKVVSGVENRHRIYI